LLDHLPAASPFELAAHAIQQWLDGPGACFATRSRRSHNIGKMDVWELELPHPIRGPQRVEICIPPDFPAVAPTIYLDKGLCLIWPHVEETGSFCHGVQPSPDDYENPIGAVQSVLARLEAFWLNTQDEAWRKKEFQAERLSYWLRFCARQRSKFGGISPACARVELEQIDESTEGRIAAYFSGGSKVSCALLLTTLSETDPHSLATRHNWSFGSLRRGHSLFVPMPAGMDWTPDEWPTTIGELDALVGSLAGDSEKLATWFMSKSPDTKQMMMVVLVQSNVCYGYLLAPPTVPRMSEVRVIPLFLDRVDADWALARDQHLPVLHSRRQLRALVLGCGSLGAMAIEQFARAGVGHIDIVDKEGFDAENCSRHILGADSLDLGKAHQLAGRLRRLVPGITVNPYRVRAERWVPTQCKPEQYDIVIDLTGETSIRSMLVRYRTLCFANTPILHGWMEPFCAATHLVHLAASDEYPIDEPAQGVNVAQWPNKTAVQLPACGFGFHPYGSADVAQAAGFVAERALAVIDAEVNDSMVWSWVRSEGFFAKLGVGAICSSLVPKLQSPFDSVHITRSFDDIYGEK